MQLYQIGARNFFILNVPPIDRSPQAVDEGPETTQGWKEDVTGFNSRLKSMIATIGTNYPDVTFFEIDMNGLFNAVLNDTAYSSITQLYMDTIHNCTAYVNGEANKTLPTMEYKSPECRYPVNKYFWLGGYHPTYPVHNLTASQIAEALQYL